MYFGEVAGIAFIRSAASFHAFELVTFNDWSFFHKTVSSIRFTLIIFPVIFLFSNGSLLLLLVQINDQIIIA